MLCQAPVPQIHFTAGGLHELEGLDPSMWSTATERSTRACISSSVSLGLRGDVGLNSASMGLLELLETLEWLLDSNCERRPDITFFCAVSVGRAMITLSKCWAFDSVIPLRVRVSGAAATE